MSEELFTKIFQIDKWIFHKIGEQLFKMLNGTFYF